MMLEVYAESRARLRDENDCLELRWGPVLDKVTRKSHSQKILLLSKHKFSEINMLRDYLGEECSEEEEQQSENLDKAKRFIRIDKHWGDHKLFLFLLKS